MSHRSWTASAAWILSTLWLSACHFDAASLPDPSAFLDAEGGDTDIVDPDVAVDTTEDPDTSDVDTAEDPDTPDVDPDVQPDCDDGEVRCTDLVLESCVEGAWTPAEDCAATCVGDACGCDAELATCFAIVCDVGATWCEDAEAWACSDDGRAATLIGTCGTDEVCVEGVCHPSSCDTTDPATCDGETRVRCVDGALETEDCWVANAYCDDAGAEARCVDWACAPDAVSCIDAHTLTQCDARGMGEEPIACPEETLCVDDACEPVLCVADTLRCAPDAVERCAPDGLSWLVDQACAETGCLDATGDHGVMCAECTADESVCDGDTLMGCDAGLWTASEDCAPRSCVDATADHDAACATCTPGDARCTASGPQRCDDEGFWGDPLTCAADQICVAGACTAAACDWSTFEDFCEGEVLIRCSYEDTLERVDCFASDRYCEVRDGWDDVCTWQLCDPGIEIDCGDFIDPGVKICNDRGSGWESYACPEGTVCAVDACVPQVCEPNTYRCDPVQPDLRQRCNSTGTAWGTAEWCNFFDHSFICVEAGACQQRICTPGTTRCAGDLLSAELCDERGVSWTTTTTCAASEFCDDSLCVPDVCEPDALWCAADYRSVVRCTAQGSGWLVDHACYGGTRCDLGTQECATPICGDAYVQWGVETCEDDNDTLCDGCESCVAQRVLNLTADTATTDGPRWRVAQDALFTLEFWLKTTDRSGHLVGWAATAEDPFDYLAVRLEAGHLEVDFGLGDTAQTTVLGGVEVSDGGWHHVAVERLAERVVATYVDGAGDAAAVIPGTANHMSSEGPLWLGCPDASRCAATAQLDDLRLTGSRRYAAAFTPQTRLEPGGSALFYDFNDPRLAETGTFWDAVVAAPLVISGATGADDDCRSGAMCGDGVLEAWEQCDDGNVSNYDGCSSVCQIEYSCSTGWRSDGQGRCVDRTTTANDWDNRESSCSPHLVAIDSVPMLAVSLLEADGSTVWVGLNDQDEEGSFVWSADGSPVNPAVSVWGVGEPNNSGGDENCVELDAEGRWNDDQCSEGHRGLCQRAASAP